MRFVEFVNEHVIPVVGVMNHDIMKPHAPLPDGRCWIFPTMTCEQHRANFQWGLDAMLWFPMSPGHAILTPHVGPAAGREEFVMVGDDKLPDEGTVDSWIDAFMAHQAKLGPSVGFSEYRRQHKQFENADAATLERIASDPRAAFREDAKVALEGDADRERVDTIEEMIRLERFGDAIGLLRGALGPRALRQRKLIDRVAWHFLSQARMCTMDGDAARAGALYQKVIDGFPDTEALRAAQREKK